MRTADGSLLGGQAFFSLALSSLLAVSMQQSVAPVQQQPPIPPLTLAPPPTKVQPPLRYESVSSAESEQGEEFPEDVELSEDEGLPPDAPTFTGLFRPSMFKLLLHKAHLPTNFEKVSTATTEAQATAGPHESLFRLSTLDKDFIPCPQLFTEVIRVPWAQPGSLTATSNQDKKLFCAAPKLEALLALPTIDTPVANLLTSSAISTDPLDGLKSEDRKFELSFRKAHQAAAWAIKTATATSFFHRAALIWLRPLQERLPPEETRWHQDINKIIAATEYSADASLSSAKFASRMLVSTVTSRRLFWLRNWKTEAKAKWKLAATPYENAKLFGTALDPLLIEDKDKRKVLPSLYRRSERRYVLYSQRQPFWAYSGPGGSASQRSAAFGGDRFQERQQFRDRGRYQPPVRKPNRGSGYKPFHRCK